MEGDRRSLRAFYHRGWRKLQSGAALEPSERIVADVIAAHPDYHGVVSDPGAVEAELAGPGLDGAELEARCRACLRARADG